MRLALGGDAEVVESVSVLSETGYHDLPAAARDRLGISAGQKNVLLRVVIRPHDRTLTDHDANQLRDRIYQALHQGTRAVWSPR